MDRGAWWAAVHGATKSRAQLSANSILREKYSEVKINLKGSVFCFCFCFFGQDTLYFMGTKSVKSIPGCLSLRVQEALELSYVKAHLVILVAGRVPDAKANRGRCKGDPFLSLKSH